MTDTACKGDSNWKQYAVHAPDVPIEKIAEFNEYKEELMADPPVQEMPVQSMITSPGLLSVIARFQGYLAKCPLTSSSSILKA